MNRRDFILASAAGGFLSTVVKGQPITALKPIRTARLVDDAAISGNVVRQSGVFDRTRLLYLYRAGSAPNGGAGANFGPSPGAAQFGIAATAVTGQLVWNYLLPQGTYISLGTYDEFVVIFALRYIPAVGTVVQRPVLLLDPANGNLTHIDTSDAIAQYTYAGDSAFFRVVAGAGEIWTIQNGLVLRKAGIASPTLGKKFTLKARSGEGAMAVVDAVGNSMAIVSLSSGSVTDTIISSNVIASNQAQSDSMIVRAGNAVTNPRLATRIFISAVAADQSSLLYAIVPELNDGPGIVTLIRLNPLGVGTMVAKIQTPLGKDGKPISVADIVVANSELGVLSPNGDIGWYALPLS